MVEPIYYLYIAVLVRTVLGEANRPTDVPN